MSKEMSPKLVELLFQTQMNPKGNGVTRVTIAKLGETLTGVSINKLLIGAAQGRGGINGTLTSVCRHICLVRDRVSQGLCQW